MDRDARCASLDPFSLAITHFTKMRHNAARVLRMARFAILASHF